MSLIISHLLAVFLGACSLAISVVVGLTWALLLVVPITLLVVSINVARTRRQGS